MRRHSCSKARIAPWHLSILSVLFVTCTCTSTQSTGIVYVNLHSRAHTLPILARHSLTPVATRFDVKLYTLVFRCISGQTSPLLSDLFCLRSVSTTHRTARLTRSQVSNGLVLPNVSRRFGLHSLSYLAAVKWNSAPDIRNATSLHDLRIQLCTWLGHPVRRPIGL